MVRWVSLLTALVIPQKLYAFPLWRTTVLDEHVDLASGALYEYRFEIRKRAYFNVVLEVDSLAFSKQGPTPTAVDRDSGVPFFAFEIRAENSTALCPSGAQYLLAALGRKSGRHAVRFVHRRDFMEEGWYRLRFIALANRAQLGNGTGAALWVKESREQSTGSAHTSDPIVEEDDYVRLDNGIVREEPPRLDWFDSERDRLGRDFGSLSPPLQLALTRYRAACRKVERQASSADLAEKLAGILFAPDPKRLQSTGLRTELERLGVVKSQLISGSAGPGPDRFTWRVRVEPQGADVLLVTDLARALGVKAPTAALQGDAWFLGDGARAGGEWLLGNKELGRISVRLAPRLSQDRAVQKTADVERFSIVYLDFVI